MNERLSSLIHKLKQKKIVLSPDMRLKEDLNLDSMNLIHLSIMIHNEFGVDLGALAEQGKKLLTIADLLEAVGDK